jgi:hypothetical protein
MTQSGRESAERGGLKGCPLWAVRSVSQGRASFTMARLKYGPAPADTADAFV